MRLSCLLGAICAWTLVAYAIPAAAVTIDFSNDPGSVITFDNTDDCVSPGDVGCFSFVPSLTNIDITSGTAAGLLGNLDGTFGVGTITALGGGLETALVNGTGTLELLDSQGGAVLQDS